MLATRGYNSLKLWNLHRCSKRCSLLREVILNAGIAAWTEHKAGDALAARQMLGGRSFPFFPEWDVGFVLNPTNGAVDQ